MPLTNQSLLYAKRQGRWIFVDIDNKGMSAEGKNYEGTTTGRMGDGGHKRGYRLHMVSLENRWPLEMELTGANAHAVPSAMVMVKRLMHRIHGSRRRRLVFRGDSSHGSVRFIKFLQRYEVGYLIKAYNSNTAKRLWREHSADPQRRIVREGKVDLLAVDLGPTMLTGMTRKKLPNGKERRIACRVMVPRVVVYREDPDQLPVDKKPTCFALLTTLPAGDFDSAALLEAAYLPRGGTIENIFCQLDQAFEITHLRSRKFYGNWTFLMLALIAATLTQMLREEAIVRQEPIPAGLHETLMAASDRGLRFKHEATAGCILIKTITNTMRK